MTLRTLKDIDLWTAHTPVLLPKDYDPRDGILKEDKWLKEFKDATRWIDIDDLHQLGREWVQELKKYFKQRLGKKGLDVLNTLLKPQDITYQECLRDKAYFIQSEYVEAHAKISIITYLFNLEEE